MIWNHFLTIVSKSSKTSSFIYYYSSITIERPCFNEERAFLEVNRLHALIRTQFWLNCAKGFSNGGAPHYVVNTYKESRNPQFWAENKLYVWQKNSAFISGDAEWNSTFHERSEIHVWCCLSFLIIEKPVSHLSSQGTFTPFNGANIHQYPYHFQTFLLSTGKWEI